MKESEYEELIPLLQLWAKSANITATVFEKDLGISQANTLRGIAIGMIRVANEIYKIKIETQPQASGDAK